MILIFIAVISLFRLAVIGGVPMSPDEAYYWAWSRVPALCYYDQPGMIAWVDWLVAAIAGGATPFTLRLGAVALSALTLWLLFLGYREYREDEGEAALFAMIFALLPFSWFYGLLIIHDAALMPWLALIFYAAARLARRDGRAGDWLLFGAALAGAFYAKFSAVMAGWGIVLFMAWSPQGRRWWRRWPPYAAGALFTALILPAVFWNVGHDFISLKAVAELTQGPVPTVSERLGFVMEYLLGQVGMFFPLIGLLVLAALIEGVRDAWRHPGGRSVLPVCLALPVLLYFLQQSLRSHVFGNWPNVSYIPLAALTMSQLSAVYSRARAGARRDRRIIQYAAIAVAADLGFVMIATAHLEFRVFRPLLNAVEARYNLDHRIDWRLDQDFGGWDEMTALVLRARPGTDFILARRYQVAGMLEFMLPDRPRVECDNEDQRGNQWDLWSRLAERRGQTALYVDVKRMPPAVQDRFERVEEVAAPLFVGEPPREVKRWFVYRAYGFRPPGPP
jgi:4-amino-4-deoxy-L-arabinose transferase-like glycosyltransferase